MAQYELDLEDEVKVIPWDGISPRVLTYGHKLLFSRREPQKNERFFVGERQYDLFPAAIRGPQVSPGAPSLFPLPDEGG